MVALLAAARAALAPSGVLRAAINLSNVVLVNGVKNDAPSGLAPSMAAELAKKLEVDLEVVTYANPGALADAADQDAWDVGLIGKEPAREKTIAFSKPYAELEATYLVPANSPLGRIHFIDSFGNSVAVSRRSAYGLWLEENLERAALHQTEEPGLAASADLFFENGCDALAGLRPWLLDLVETDPRFAGATVFQGRFAAVHQALGVPKTRDVDAALPFLEDFVADARASGLVADLIDEHGVTGKIEVSGFTRAFPPEEEIYQWGT